MRDSIGEAFFKGSNYPEVVKRWQEHLLIIYKQEIGRLATVLNLLRFVDGPLNLEREDFQFRNFQYPFQFALESLSKADELYEKLISIFEDQKKTAS